MRTFARSTAFASLPLSLFLLSACPVNSETLDGQPGETSCSEATKAFDSSGARRPSLALGQLPVGIYTHVSAELYAESELAQPDGGANIIRVQFLATPIPNSNPAAYATITRCREASGTFGPFYVQPLFMTDFVNYDRTRFDVVTHAYTLTFKPDFSTSLDVGGKYEARNNPSSTVTQLLNQNWNQGFHFAWRGGEQYEFYGQNVESASGRKIFGKATFVRSDL